MIGRIATGLAAGILLFVATARAESPDDEIARAHFATGLSYYETARYEAAVKEFLEAYRLSRRTAFLYNIARSYEKLDDPGRATAYYRRFLAAEPASADRAQIESALAAFVPRVGTLAVRTVPPGAAVTIDGADVGLSPVEAQPLSVGEHEVTARGEGNAFASERVQVAARAELVLNLDLARGSAVEAPRRGWVAPLLGVVGVAVVAALVTGLVLGLSTDYAAVARSGCTGSCFVLDFGAGP